MKRNMREWKRSIIENRAVQALPIMTYPGLELTGMKVMDIIANGENQAACIENLANIYGRLRP